MSEARVHTATADPACVLARSSLEFLQLPLTFSALSPSVLCKLATTQKSSLRAFGTARMRVSGTICQISG